MADLYPSMTALLAARTEGVDYTITTIKNPFSPVTITAVHGGNIERGTSEVGALIREYGNYNYFSFNCLLDTNPSDLHVTSTNYDEPNVLGMMAGSDYVVGIHGKSGTDESIYIGGLDSAFRNIIWTKLEEAGFNCVLAPEGIAGQEPMNITNRTRSGGGVQLETTTNLRKSFFIDGDWNNRVRENWSQKMYDFAHAVHDAIQEFVPTMSTDADTSYKMDLKEDLNYGAGAKADLKSDINATNQNIATNAPQWSEAYARVQDWKGATENGKVTVRGDLIQAGTILVDRMAIGNFDNMYQNGSYELGAVGWKPASAWSIVQDASVAYTGNFYAKGVWGGASSVSFYDTKEIQVREGEKYFWEGYFKTDVATSTKTRTMLIKLIDKAGTETFIIKEETLTTSWQKFAYTFDIPTGTVKIVLGLSVKSGQPAGFSTLVDNVFCKKMLTGELIVDGQITAAMIKSLNGLNVGNGQFVVDTVTGAVKIGAGAVLESVTIKTSQFEAMSGNTISFGAYGAKIDTSIAGTIKRTRFATNDTNYLAIDDDGTFNFVTNGSFNPKLYKTADGHNGLKLGSPVIKGLVGQDTVQIRNWDDSSYGALAASDITATGNLIVNGTSSLKGVTTITSSSGGMFKLVGTADAYIEFFPDGTAAGRKGFIGHEAATGNNFVIQTATDEIILKTDANRVKIDNGVGGVYFKDQNDNAYVPIYASAFTVNSLRETKKDIVPFEKTSMSRTALEEILCTTVYNYRLNSDTEFDPLRVGLIYEESPFEFLDLRGNGLDTYPMNALTIQAIKDIVAKYDAKIDLLENEIAILKGS